MRRVMVSFLVCGLTLFIANSVFAEQVIADSRIQEVVVYPDSALVSRSADLKLGIGQHQIVFSDIIPEIDENSLRVEASDDGCAKILGAQVKKEFIKEEASQRVSYIQEEIQKLEDEMRRLEDTKNILGQERQFLDSLRLFSAGQLPKDLVTKMPVVKDLDETLKFLSARLKENYNQALDAELNSRDIFKKTEVLKRELSQISGPSKKIKRSIMVEVEVVKPVSFGLTASYLVKGASWQPLYDARANFEKSEVEMVSCGIIRQTTGEDWQDVEISLSTAKPTIGGRMAYVSPWFLRLDQSRFTMESRNNIVAGQFASFSSSENAGEPGLAKDAIAEQKGTAVVYKLLRKATVKSDGSEYKLPVSIQTLKAEFGYSTYPRNTPCAYLGSRVTNAKDLQLLAGRVNIFLEGDFVGASSIDNIGPGEDFDLYLGVDENVKVKREQIEKKVNDVLIAGILSPNCTTTFKYKATIENYKNKNIKVIFFESMPVSDNERIKVRIGKPSLEPKEKNWKDRKGVWRWKLELEPKQKQEIFYAFSIEHSRDMRVEGL